VRENARRLDRDIVFIIFCSRGRIIVFSPPRVALARLPVRLRVAPRWHAPHRARSRDVETRVDARATRNLARSVQS
jgi:hypothetical protein